jgi:hypothetical protein
MPDLRSLTQVRIDRYDIADSRRRNAARRQLARAIASRFEANETHITVANVTYDDEQGSIEGTYDGVRFRVLYAGTVPLPSLFYGVGRDWQPLNTESEFRRFAKWLLTPRTED